MQLSTPVKVAITSVLSILLAVAAVFGLAPAPVPCPVCPPPVVCPVVEAAVVPVEAVVVPAVAPAVPATP